MSFMGHYVLDHLGVAHPEPDLAAWGRWMESHERHVASSNLGEVWISTVFLGLDHAHFSGPPVLFETMVFGGRHDLYGDRYHTRTEALLGHQRIVHLVRDTQDVTNTSSKET